MLAALEVGAFGKHGLCRAPAAPPGALCLILTPEISL
jgi:hypothetical protein